MEIMTICQDRVLELRLQGELDHHGARGLLARMEREIEAALPVELVLDFGGVTFMDSAGIAVALRGWQRMRELGGRIELHHVAAQPRKVLETAGIGRMMTIQ